MSASQLPEQPEASTSTLSTIDTPIAADTAVQPSEEPILSKNARKRLAKQEAAKVWKAQRKIKEKEGKKRKQAERREAIAAGEQVEPSRKKWKPAESDKTTWDGQCLLELAFDEKMVEKEIKSLQQQIAHCYSAMRYSVNPMPLLCTSFNGQLADRFNGLLKRTYESWTGVTFTEDSLETMISNGEVQKDALVYLTADSDNVLDELETGKTYIIGALVDKNRYKNLCYDRAKSLGIAHAQLPIGKYIQNMTTRKVLTVNQCYDILLRWIETRNWEEAFYAVIPKRKFEEPKKSKKKQKKEEEKKQTDSTTGTNDNKEGQQFDQGDEEGDEASLDSDEGEDDIEITGVEEVNRGDQEKDDGVAAQEGDIPREGKVDDVVQESGNTEAT